MGSLRVRRAAATRARQETELAERHRRKMETAAANRASFLERRRDIARRLAAGAHSPSTKHSRSDDAAADAIRRAWLRFRRDGDTTEAVASRYRALGLSEATARSSDDFDAFAGMLSNPHTLRTTRALLNRAQHRLAARGREFDARAEEVLADAGEREAHVRRRRRASANARRIGARSSLPCTAA